MKKVKKKNECRAMIYDFSFINGSDCSDEVQQLDRMSKITKQDVVDWANKYLGPESYAIVYKREGKDPNEQKIAAPKITPIVTNRDSQSEIHTEIQNSKIKTNKTEIMDNKKNKKQKEAQDILSYHSQAAGCTD